MSREEQLDELLDRWEESFEQGKSITPEELCRDCPELIDALREQIDDLQSMNQVLDLSQDTTEQEDPINGPNALENPEIHDEQLTAPIALTQPQFHAKGGLGVVYKASDSQLHREVAVKFLHKGYAHQSDNRDRFCREAEITSRLDHPGIVPVHGIGETQDGRPFYVMRFVRGETFESAIKNYYDQKEHWHEHKRHLEFRALLTRYVSVCNTIAYAHTRGIIHRDIKPENIMLGHYGETLVVDWGLALPVQRDADARASGERTLLPQTGRRKKNRSNDQGAGTPTFMSPEQADGNTKIGTASDIYSLGALLYKILTGQGPVDGRQLSLPEIRKKIREGQFVRPRELSRKISRSLEAVCLKAMSLAEAKRYSSALELAEDVERYLADERVGAYHEAPIETPFRWFRQHRRMAQVTLFSILSILLVLIGSSIWLGVYARKTTSVNEELLQSAAKLTALTVAMEINDRWRILEMESHDPELIRLLSEASASQDQNRRESLLHWLGRTERYHRETATAESWFLCDSEGLQAARIPESASIGKSYGHRDYFHGNGLDLEPDKTGTPAHINDVYLSVPYQSSNDGDMKVAFSIPVWSARIGGRFLGVLGMSIKLGHFEILQQKLAPNQIAVLVNLDRDQMDGEVNSGLILHHPRLSDKIHEDVRSFEITAPRLEKGLVEDLQQFRTRRLRERRTGISESSSSGFLQRQYKDPTADLGNGFAGQWIAAYEPVFVEGRSIRAQDTGWVVIVQKQPVSSKSLFEK